MNENSNANTKATEKTSHGRTRPRIVIIPHYVGTEKAETLIKEIITDEIRKKIDKTA